MNRRRLAVYGVAFGVAVFALWAYIIATGSGLRDRNGQPIGTDFVTFYAASEIALNQPPERIYDITVMGQTEADVIGSKSNVTEWHYPPAYLLAVLPLSLLPYLVALGVWLAAGTAAFAVTVRRISTDWLAVLLLVSFPGFFRNFTQGQNGFFSAALLGSGLMLLHRRPVLAGVFLGLMTFKPHFAVLVFLALLVGREWKTLGSATATALVTSGIAFVLFGVESYEAFIDHLPRTTEVLYNGQVNLEKMHTMSSAALLTGASSGVAQAVQVIASGAVAGVVLWTWRSGANSNLKFAALGTGIVAAAPFLFDYDLILLALPVLWLAVDGRERGWLSGEREMLFLCWILPFLAAVIVTATSVMITPFVLFALLALIVRRVWHHAAAERPAETSSRPLAMVA